MLANSSRRHHLFDTQRESINFSREKQQQSLAYIFSFSWFLYANVVNVELYVDGDKDILNMHDKPFPINQLHFGGFVL